MTENLKYVRKKLKLSQEQFANRIGISNKVYSNFETGRSKIPADIIPKICTELEISPNELFGWENLITR